MEMLNRFITTLIDGYGVAGLVLIVLFVLFFTVQMVQICKMLIVARFKLTSLPQTRKVQPPVSVVIPLFGEDEEYLKGDFRVLLSQSCANYEVVAVYVGKEDSYYATLKHLRKFYKHLKTTQIDYAPQYPITTRLALNVGIKTATYD